MSMNEVADRKHLARGGCSATQGRVAVRNTDSGATLLRPCPGPAT